MPDSCSAQASTNEQSKAPAVAVHPAPPLDNRTVVLTSQQQQTQIGDSFTATSESLDKAVNNEIPQEKSKEMTDSNGKNEAADSTTTTKGLHNP